MLNVYLARHGQNEDNANGVLNGHRDLPLTELGVAQAYELAGSIKSAGLAFDVVLSSPLSRALRTAEIVASVNNLPRPVIMPELIERDFGSMTGILQSKIEELCAPDIIKTETVTYFLSPDGTETFPDLLQRADKLLKELDRQYEDSQLLLVTHSDVGKMIYAAYYNLDWKEVLTQFHFGNSDLLLLSPDSTPNQSRIFITPQRTT